jgi:hypothetical protein
MAIGRGAILLYDGLHLRIETNLGRTAFNGIIAPAGKNKNQYKNEKYSRFYPAQHIGIFVIF